MRLSHGPAALIAIVGLAWASRAAHGQGQAFTNLTEVEVKQISNGVRIVFDFDGIFRLQTHVVPDWATFPTNDWPPVPQRVQAIRFQFTNARTQAGAFFDVSRYPVSHVELSIPPGAPEGIGLDAAVILDQPTGFRDLETANDDWCCFDPPPLPNFDIRDSQDRRQLIVTVLSDRLPQQPEARRTAEEAAGMAQDLSVENHGGILSVHALNAPLKAVAQALSEATGVSITVDDACRRFIHLFLPAASLGETLNLLGRGYDLAVSAGPAGTGYWITDGSPELGSRYPALATGYVPLHYLKAADAADLLPDFLRRSLRPDEGRNGLVVSGSPALIDKVRGDVSAIDRPAPEIEVEVTAAEVSSLDDLTAGLAADFEGTTFDLHGDASSGDLRFETGLASHVDWNVRLNALASAGRVRIVSRPKARLQSGGVATLFVGAEQLIQVRVGTYGRQDFDVATVRSGTTLEVGAWTGGNGDVTMSIKPSVSVLVGRTADGGLPIIDTRSAAATIRAHDGGTIIIGGLRQRSRYATRRKIPLIGDLPLIGGLFRWTQRSRPSDDLVLFVTPHIVGDMGRVPS